MRILSFFRDSGVPIGLATSTHKTSATWKLEEVGFDSFFHSAAYGDEVEKTIRNIETIVNIPKNIEPQLITLLPK